jgi:hypothetical protein
MTTGRIRRSWYRRGAATLLPVAGLLTVGLGAQPAEAATAPTITTIEPAGTTLGQAQDVAVNAQGDIYVSDPSDSIVSRITPLGVVTTFAGQPEDFGYGGDGGPATDAILNEPEGLAVDAAGDLFIADTGNDVIREVTPSGTISTVAGTANPDTSAGDSGDGGPATDAVLDDPTDVAVDAAGDLFISDALGGVIREVTPGGTISTVAGDGGFGTSGDGGPAVDASFEDPLGVAVDSSGDLYVVDNFADVVREVTPDGTISTVAGSIDTGGYSGDGGPATEATLDQPSGIALDTAGDLYIADTANDVIREVTPDGTINTVAGTPGTAGDTGDGGPATSATLDFPTSVAVDGAGNLYIADGTVRTTAPRVAIDGSTLTVVSSDTPPVVQGSCCGVTFTGGSQLFIPNTAVGQSTTLSFSVPTSGTYDLALTLTEASDYGILTASVDGNQVGEPFDGYSPAVAVSQPVDFGDVSLSAGTHDLTLTTTGAAASAAGFKIGLDLLQLNLVGPPSTTPPSTVPEAPLTAALPLAALAAGGLGLAARRRRSARRA